MGNVAIHHGLRQQTDQIQRETYCEELRNLLPQWPRPIAWTVEQDDVL